RHKDLKKVDAELVLKEDIPPVIIHEDKLRQVFMNLFINAAEAMPEGGHVTVETGVKSHAVDRGMKRRKSDPDFTGADWERRIKEYVTVSFKDTGCGIKKEDMDKIFDPFFTTKEIGRGTGLGLFISRSIVNAYGGTIEVGSEEGKGSVFTVLIEAKR
ncbi:MAG TPA: ATP-binding protein, partial [Thermodesulfobacteriota bacterium]|nr:ATP-binding protein [Thermodesulfobacteriota bacterium]